MKLLGLEIRRASAVKAEAAPLPTRRSDGALTEIMPPFGTNPPSRPASEMETDQSIDNRLISNDPRELWYLALPTKLSPNQVQLILRSAQGGDLWQQFQLGQLMLDTWPMLRKCDHELREAVSSVRYVARPYCEEGDEPTPAAKEKADLVNRCFRSMKANPFNDERNFRGMVYHLAGGFLMGLVMEELIWNKVRAYPKFGPERRLKAAAFIHPRHFTYTNDGMIALFDDNYSRLYYNMAKLGQAPDQRKFLCGQFYSSSGSVLGAGFLRPLAWYWSSVVFNREWMARMAQNYGAPFLDVTYKPGMTPQELSTLDANIKAGLANRFIRHVEGTTLVTTPAASLGSENPQRYLAENADKQCQLLILGQTLTSDVGDSGSRALGDTHMEVRGDRVQGVARWVASEGLQQLAQAILLVNYGEDDECPIVEPDFTKPLEPLEQATFLTAISNCSLPLPAEETYAKIGVSMPEEGDKVLIRGQIGLLGSTDQLIDPSPEPELPGEFEEDPAQGVDGDGQDEEQEDVADEDAVNARLSKMSPEEIATVENAVVKAEAARYPNGEWETVKIKLRGSRGKV